MQGIKQDKLLDSAEYNAFHIVSTILAILTFGITSLIIISFCACKSKLSSQFMLITFLSITDLIFAVVFLPALALQDYKSFCQIQAFGINFSTTSSLIWTAIITYAMFQSTVKGQPRSIIFSRKNIMMFYIYGYLIPGILSLLPFTTNSYGESGFWCWIGSKSSGQSDTILKKSWAFFFYAIYVVSIKYTIVLYVKIWNWMQAQASQQQKANIKLISLIPLVHFIAIFQGVINRVHGYTIGFGKNQIEISALYWMQNIFDFLQRIVVGFMFGLNPLFLKQFKKICCQCYCFRNKRLEQEHQDLITFENNNSSIRYNRQSQFKNV